MKLLFFFISSLILFVLPVSSHGNRDLVTIKGKLLNFGAVVELENFSELQYLLPKTSIQKINPDKDSSFSIAFSLKSPGYYRLGRNKLYLSPGDEMDIIIDLDNPILASFTGKGSIANNYLKNTPFPKGGSFLEAGRNIQATPHEMLKFILKTADTRSQELQSLKGISKHFIRLEKARIHADIIKSIMSVNTYSYVLSKSKPKEYIQAYADEFGKIAQPVLDSLLKGFANPEYLQVEVYRDIIDKLDLGRVKPADSQIIKDWESAYKLAFSKIKPLNDKTQIPALRQEVSAITTKKYHDALNMLLDEKMKFGTGDQAIDFTVRNQDGTNTTLSSLKGKVIYIDIWATWCGPCMAEMPYLETLKKKFESNPDVAIVSLSIDENDPIWLKDLERRKPGGIQWRIDRPKLASYEVLTIPRFILIDKKFVVSEMQAPRPSTEELRKKIDLLISK